MCQAFKEIVKVNNKAQLLIAGNGEDENKIRKFINNNNLQNNIKLLGYIGNIYPYFKNSKCFILTSLWEDPGWVLVEAAFCRTPVITSDAWPGPTELIKDNFNGLVFKNNVLNSFLKKFKNFEDHNEIDKLKLQNLNLSKKFTVFSHYKSLSEIL